MTGRVERPGALLELARGGGGLDALRGALAAVDPLAIEGDRARIAFWLNAYNALVTAELARRPRSGTLMRHRRMFGEEIARIGGQGYSLDEIEHGVLRLNARPPYRLRRPFAGSDPRRGASPSRLDPRIHFALNCGARSCPPIHPYGAGELDAELERTTASYLRAETELDRERGRVALPYLMRLYRADFGDPLDFALPRLEPADADWARSRRPRVSFAGFDWTLEQG